MYVTRSFILMKIKSFSCEMFWMSTQSEKRGKQQLGSGSKVCIWAKWPISPALIPVSVTWCEYFYYHLNRMHGRITPNIKSASTYLYTWVKWGSVGVKWDHVYYWHLRPSVDRYWRSTPRSTHDRHSIDTRSTSRSTLDWHTVDISVDRLSIFVDTLWSGDRY